MIMFSVWHLMVDYLRTIFHVHAWKFKIGDVLLRGTWCGGPCYLCSVRGYLGSGSHFLNRSYMEYELLYEDGTCIPVYKRYVEDEFVLVGINERFFNLFVKVEEWI